MNTIPVIKQSTMGKLTLSLIIFILCVLLWNKMYPYSLCNLSEYILVIQCHNKTKQNVKNYGCILWCVCENITLDSTGVAIVNII